MTPSEAARKRNRLHLWTGAEVNSAQLGDCNVFMPLFWIKPVSSATTVMLEGCDTLWAHQIRLNVPMNEEESTLGSFLRWEENIHNDARAALNTFDSHYQLDGGEYQQWPDDEDEPNILELVE